MAENFNSRTERGSSFFDNSTFFYGWKNSEPDVNDQDFKVLYNELKSSIRGKGDFTQGSILFASSTGEATEDNTQVFWDDTLNNLGIGTNTPEAKLHVVANSNLSDFVFRLDNLSGQKIFEVQDNGVIDVGTGNSRIIAGIGANSTLSNFNISSPTFITPLNFANQILANAKIINVGTVLSPTGGADKCINFSRGGTAGSGLPNSVQIFGEDVGAAGNTVLHIFTGSGDTIVLNPQANWQTATGTATTTTFDTTTVTLQGLAERVKALIDAFFTNNIGLLKN